MKVVDQNDILNSQRQALVPSPVLIDGRTEQDWLSFLAEFATVINFYDSDNNINGNWSPFLLKDPVFLLAHISKTRFNKYHSLYNITCASLKGVLNDDQRKTDMGGYFNQLFDQFAGIFMQIKRWVYFMHRSPGVYDLKSYVTHQTRINFSRYFWAIVSLRQNLYMASRLAGLKPIDTSEFYFFDAYDEKLWNQNKDKTPYWDVLGLQYAVSKNLNTNDDYFNALTRVGEELFNFFYIIISKAAEGFEQLKTQQSGYPDTTLLRSFVNLLQIHQDQLNGIAQKHLDFYYKDILLQTERFAQPDSTYLFAELATTNATFNLPAGTQFFAGVDAQKNPILFANGKAANINPAVIIQAYTLAALQAKDGAYSFSLQNIATPGLLQTDAAGNVQQWDTFGGTNPTPVNTGIAFASPMLLLKEGQRNIKFSFGCIRGYDLLQLLNSATFYLSTQKTWLLLDKKWIDVDIANTPTLDPLNEIVLLTINLNPSQPPIEPFTKNPDGLESAWPMLKIELPSLYDTTSPPVLTSLIIDVTVSQLKTFQLYNDNGALSTKTPYQLFGPIPLVNNSFIIGNNEIFSKPVTSLYIELHWDNLPDNFTTYYQQYNNYLAPILTPPTPPKKTPEPVKPTTDADTADENPIVKFLWDIITWPIKFLWRVLVWVTTFLWGIIIALGALTVKLIDWIFDPHPNTDIPFNNVCFNVDFELLQASSWQTLSMNKTQQVTFPGPDKISALPYQLNTKCTPNADTDKIQLFSTEDKDAKGNPVDCQLIDSSYFAYITPVAAENVDPAIQSTPLKFNDSSTSGFMKMVLTDPKYGFGSQIYANVVADIALQNAIQIKKDTTNFITPANLPFAPKAASFLAHYTAKQSYTFTQSQSTAADYPIQCFLYSPFETHKVYDNRQSITNYQYNICNTTSTASSGLPLFLPFNYNGYLYIAMNYLIPSESLGIYFELARKYMQDSSQKQVDTYYLSTAGWKPLSVIADGTNNFSCSGIITVNIPGDIAVGGAAMPGDKNCWLTFAIKSGAASVAKTTFLKTNGFEVTRTGSSFLANNIAPQILSNTITRPQVAIPQIAKISQPFPSSGGTIAESREIMNQRISSRLKTKDKAVNAEDYFRLIKQEFADVYYSKAIFNHQAPGNTGVYVVQACQSATNANAFVPLVSECTESKVQSFLTDRTSAFSNIVVSNFDLQYVLVQATVTIKPGFAGYAVQKNINDALNIFLSPWISSTLPQIAIDQGIRDIQVIKLIRGVDGVLQVSGIAFKTWPMSENYTDEQIANLPFNHVMAVLPPSALIVPFTVHSIICKPAA